MGSPRKILVVEDEPLIAMMLEDFLSSLGHEVVAICEDVPSACAHAQQGGFDLAILDVNLKGDSVWPVATALKEQGISFILASGGFVDRPPAEFVDSPMIDKPYTIDRVSAKIAEVLDGAAA
ncbi:response regulator [Sphingomonas jaspsi]|uniref:response regulator n=1 Tax=Sphingomonas jaspsi TaxID=392409 RepID=UPI000563D422|nr:response regulator [Sphingomonas jaspsi]